MIQKRPTLKGGWGSSPIPPDQQAAWKTFYAGRTDCPTAANRCYEHGITPDDIREAIDNPAKYEVTAHANDGTYASIKERERLLILAHEVAQYHSHHRAKALDARLHHMGVLTYQIPETAQYSSSKIAALIGVTRQSVRQSLSRVMPKTKK